MHSVLSRKREEEGNNKMRRPFSEYNWNNHCLCDQHLNAVANLIAEEETREEQNKKIKIQRGLTTFFAKRIDK